MSTHDKAQRESQPVPYWKGHENVIKALRDGALKSSDFNSRGVLDLRAGIENSCSNTPYGRQQRPLALATQHVEFELENVKSVNEPVKNVEVEKLQAEVACLKEQLVGLSKLLHDFSLLYISKQSP